MMPGPFHIPQAAKAAAVSRHMAVATAFERVRRASLNLASPLSFEDMQLQSMTDASPTKWHLAHTSWFFESFILAEYEGEFAPHHAQYDFLFNSYYEAKGLRHARHQRGLLSRPPVADILEYRAAVDERMMRLLPELPEAALELVILGLHHEMQHQELLLTDLLHAFSFNAIDPAYSPDRRPNPRAMPERRWENYAGGIRSIGHDGQDFAFDNECPRHEVLLRPYRLASTLVTNGEWLDFIEDGGYETATLWLSDGWAECCKQAWQAPLYWRRDDDEHWSSFTLHGRLAIDRQAPVCHISYYEADAFARWAGKRLPTEFEWERAATNQPIKGHFVETGIYAPLAPGDGDQQGLLQLFGSVWEWTQSAYAAYPGFRPGKGAVGEYNGKFMANQMVLRGGSCVTPQAQLRTTYRNFFYPHQRWQFAGLRLAEDG